MKNYTLYAMRYTLILFLLADIIGCDAFVRKFTRKPKEGSISREEMVLVPQEYKPTMDKEQLYRQYFVFWKSWQDELITALSFDLNPNYKKQVDCANEAIKNLMNLRTLLKADKQKQLDVYIGQLVDLKDMIVQDPYSSAKDFHRRSAERIRRDILQYFSFGDVKKFLI